MTLSHAGFLVSSKRNPCPICARTKDGDCRISDDGKLVLCHSEVNGRQPKEELNGFIWLGSTTDHLWGKWIAKSEDWQKDRPVGKEYRYPFCDRDGKVLVEEVRIYTADGKKAWMDPKGVDTSLLTPYRYLDALQALKSGAEYCLVVEGPPKAEALWELGIPAVAFANGFKVSRDSHWFEGFEALLVVVPDQDKPGLDKAHRILESYPMARLLKPWPTSAWWSPEWLPEKGGKDIADWIREGATKDEIVAAIEHPKAPADTRRDRFLLDLTALSEETNPVEFLRLKAEFSRSYSMPRSDVDEALLALAARRTAARKTSVSLGQFLNQQANAIPWLLPGLIPTGEMVLLAASAKVGKTNLATDLMYAILTGQEVLGETPAKKGKVLFITTDEGSSTTQRRLIERGFDLLSPELLDRVRILTGFDISHQIDLEEDLKAFQPDLVVIDSLTGITQNLAVSENDAEFARIIYRLKDLLARYGAASILIHHENKDKDARGISRVAGSARITAAVNSIWQLTYQSAADETKPQRILRIKARETDSFALSLEFNPRELWSSNGIFKCYGELDDESGETKSISDRVLALLQSRPGVGLTAGEIKAYLNSGNPTYMALTRLTDRGVITRRRSQTNIKSWVYEFPAPLSPIVSPLESHEKPIETTTTIEFEALHHPTITLPSLNHHSTITLPSHPPTDGSLMVDCLTHSNVDGERDTADEPSLYRGVRGGERGSSIKHPLLELPVPLENDPHPVQNPSFNPDCLVLHQGDWKHAQKEASNGSYTNVVLADGLKLLVKTADLREVD